MTSLILRLTLSTLMPMTQPCKILFLQLSTFFSSSISISYCSVFCYQLGPDGISSWGAQNLVKFNASKTQFLSISLSTIPSNCVIDFENNVIPPPSCINILGVNITHNMSWRQHILELARSASKKLGVLFRCRASFLLSSSFSSMWDLYV